MREISSLLALFSVWNLEETDLNPRESHCSLSGLSKKPVSLAITHPSGFLRSPLPSLCHGREVSIEIFWAADGFWLMVWSVGL